MARSLPFVTVVLFLQHLRESPQDRRLFFILKQTDTGNSDPVVPELPSIKRSLDGRGLTGGNVVVPEGPALGPSLRRPLLVTLPVLSDMGSIVLAQQARPLTGDPHWRTAQVSS